MEILCLIDSLGSGGAQRQLATLAVGLKKRGHDVRFLIYHPHDHFMPVLEAADISCRMLPPASHGSRLLAVRNALRQGRQDAVLAFLEGPAWYAELAGIPRRRWGLVVGERSANPRIRNGNERWLRHFHRLADAVVCNSHTNRLMLETEFPFLKDRLTTIYNTIDLKTFHPERAEHSQAGKPRRIVVAASYQENKNMLGVAKALLLMRNGGSTPEVVVDWYGATPSGTDAFERAERFIIANGLADCMRLHPATKRIEEEYANASAVGLFSFFEGLPNVVCEAMACGRPVILSNVCDAGNLVNDGVNGFLCDPNSQDSIANAFTRLASATSANLESMGAESRQMAESMFSEDEGISRFEKILEIATARLSLPTGCSWPPTVPESALRSVNQ